MTKTNIKLALLLLPILLLGTINVAFAATTDSPPQIDFESPPALILPGATNNPAPPCTDNDTQNNNSKICQSGVFVLCDASKEGTKTADGQKQCTSGFWTTVVSNNNPPQPPNDGNGQTTSITISNFTISPKEFNPTLAETKISYKISKSAKMEIKVYDSKGQVVTTLTNNETLNSGSHDINWIGTKNNLNSGELVSAGVYTVKLLAKNTTTSVTEDSKQGDVTVTFPKQGNTGSDGSSSGSTGSTGQSGSTQQGSNSQQAQAAMALNNSQSGATAQTGPGVLIYPIIPAIAYFVRRKTKR